MERKPCVPAWDCPYLDKPTGCFEDIDHKYGPRRSFKTKIEKDFRELEENKTLTCRREHDERHATEPFPDKPDRDFMIQAIAKSRQREKIRRATKDAKNAAD